MTKSRKPAAITFPSVSTYVRENAETGVRIVKSEPDNGDGTYYSVLAPTRNGTEYDHIFSTRTLADAREWATERVEMVRERVAEDYVEALRIEQVETDRVIAEVVDAAREVERSGQVEAHAASRIVSTLLFGARMSATAGFVQVGRERLARARAILAGTEVVLADADREAARAEHAARLPRGQRVILTTGQRNGMSAKVDGDVRIEAETGRAFVTVKLLAGGYRTEWCDSLLTEGDARYDRLLAEAARQLG